MFKFRVFRKFSRILHFKFYFHLWGSECYFAEVVIGSLDKVLALILIIVFQIYLAVILK